MSGALFSKLDKESQKFINTITLKGAKNKIITLAIAKCLADSIILPPTKVENIDNYYNVNDRIATEDLVFTINEMMPIDTALVLTYIKSFMKFRYNTLYPEAYYFSNSNDGVYNLFGLAKVIDLETLEAIKENSAELIAITNSFNKVFQTLRK